jgi:hypothetical protein
MLPTGGGRQALLPRMQSAARHAAEVVSHFNYISRIADGLGVDLEGWMKRQSGGTDC